MRTADFNFTLPPELIAQWPVARRDQSKLLVLDRATGGIAHRRFCDVATYLRAGDILVRNDSRVIAARLRGRNLKTGGHFEMLLLRENSPNDWWCLARPGKRARPGVGIEVLGARQKSTGIIATVGEVNSEGHRRLAFAGTENILTNLATLGQTPLPPYIQRARPGTFDRRRYQTVYAQSPGSVAAPTAGLHFTQALLAKIRAMGARVCFVTLHVGPGTFAPVKVNSLDQHVMHEEFYEVGPETAAILSSVKPKPGVPPAPAGASSETRPPRVIAVGTTNFHLRFSTLLMLVSGFAAPGSAVGREMILRAYEEAIRERYRFFSYGDAMLIGEGWRSERRPNLGARRRTQDGAGRKSSRRCS